MKQARILYWVTDQGRTPDECGARLPACPRPPGVPVEAGVGGTLFTLETGVLALSVEPGLTWFPLGDGATWCGLVPGRMPEPADLERPALYDAHEVTVGGKRWRIPVGRFLAGGTGLPTVRALDLASGKPVWKVRREYAELHAYAERAFDALQQNGGWADEDADAAVAAAFAVGYRIGLPELLALEVLTREAVREVLRALLDWPAVERVLREHAEKKNLPIAGGA